MSSNTCALNTITGCECYRLHGIVRTRHHKVHVRLAKMTEDDDRRINRDAYLADRDILTTTYNDSTDYANC